MSAEIESTDALIRAAGHSGEIRFRPPYGKKLITLPWYLARTDRTTVLWDIEPDSDPAVAASADRIAAHVLERAAPGSIILLHVMYPARATSLAAVPAILEGLAERGLRAVTVAELLAAQ